MSLFTLQVTSFALYSTAGDVFLDGQVLTEVGDFGFLDLRYDGNTGFPFVDPADGLTITTVPDESEKLGFIMAMDPGNVLLSLENNPLFEDDFLFTALAGFELDNKTPAFIETGPAELNSPNTPDWVLRRNGADSMQSISLSECNAGILG